MKRFLGYAPIFLCVVYAFIPICVLTAEAIHIQIQVCFPMATVILYAGASLLVTVLLYKENFILTKVSGWISVLAFLMSLLNGYCFLSYSISWVFSLICSVCCLIWIFKFTQPFAGRVLAVAGSALLAAVLLFAGAFSMLFQGIRADTVVRSVMSPQNTYIAEVIDSDQGALGGNTFVEVRQNKTVYLFVCKFQERSVCIYTGEWGEFETMQVSWQDEHTLLIDGKAYSVNL